MPVAAELGVRLADIEDARSQIRDVAWRTPLVPAGRHEDGKVYLKLECLQRTGSFKIRGAWNKMSRLTAAERRRGYVTVSAGNHGQAVAWSAQRLRGPCTVWVPETAVERKVQAMEALGATVRRLPHDEIMQAMVDGRFAKGRELFVHPFGDPHVIAGQGTIGLELVEDLPDVRTVLVPVGGGGLSVGIAAAVRARAPKARVYGVQAANAAPLAASWKSGRPERTSTPKTIADGIAASVVFDYMFPHLQTALDGVLTVSEEEMMAAMQHLAKETHVVAEAAGAASLAAARANAKKLRAPIACIVSGGNVDPALLSRLVAPAAPTRP